MSFEKLDTNKYISACSFNDLNVTQRKSGETLVIFYYPERRNERIFSINI